MEILAGSGQGVPVGGNEHPAVFHMLDVDAVSEILPVLHFLGKIGETFLRHGSLGLGAFAVALVRQRDGPDQYCA